MGCKAVYAVEAVEYLPDLAQIGSGSKVQKSHLLPGMEPECLEDGEPGAALARERVDFVESCH